MTVTPVPSKAKPNEVVWPLNNRAFVRGWNARFFTHGEFKPETTKSAEWNRGAYLTDSLGHCGACHTPKNTLGADKSNEYMKGAVIDHWVAPNLISDAAKGLRDWSVDDIVEYLKHGRNAYAQAGGPMDE